MKLLKNNYILILIIALGAFLRINTDTFLCGYNFDEFAIISIAKQNLSTIFKTISNEDYHAPLYYLICHPFLNIKEPYILLRILNVLFSLINIYIFYKIGKTLANKKVGLILALFLAVNHLHISVANFIKFYSLNILLISCATLFFIKNIKYNKSKKELIITNILFTLSFTYGYIFTISQFLILYFLKNKKEIIKNFALSSVGFLIYLPILLTQARYALDSQISAHAGYPKLSFLSLYVFLNDYFTPLINYSCNTETIESIPLLISWIRNSKDIISIVSFILLSLIPVLISCLGVAISVKKNKTLRMLFIQSLSYFIFTLILILAGINGFIPIYIFPTGFILVFLSSFGLILIKNKIKYFLIFYLILAQLIITNDYPMEKRETKTKPYGNIDNYIEKINSNIAIIMFDTARFAKYYYKNKNIVPFDYEELRGSHGKKLFDIIFYSDKKNNKKNLNTFIKDEINKNKTSNKLIEHINSKIQKNDKIILIFNTNSASYLLKKEEINRHLDKKYDYHLIDTSLFYQIQNKDLYLNQDILGDIIQSYSTKKIIEVIEKQYKPIKIEQFLPIPMKNYTKTNEFTYNKNSILNLLEKPIAGWIFVTYQKQ